MTKKEAEDREIERFYAEGKVKFGPTVYLVPSKYRTDMSIKLKIKAAYSPKNAQI